MSLWCTNYFHVYSAGSSASDDSRSGASSSYMFAEAITSETLCSGASSSHYCGSAYLTSQIDGNLPGTFAGKFRAVSLRAQCSA